MAFSASVGHDYPIGDKQDIRRVARFGRIFRDNPMNDAGIICAAFKPVAAGNFTFDKLEKILFR
jgi:hypothetical protein